ncbi:hypothetical protein EQG49_01005 [Periweissella cryptocerci]|uniref:Uncharacterized protein n=1 Tax=Periweissella cryptocerci TaxID=2506420 RepID=A0A4P6YR84_9LACO|nr:hypothetical protein [Periweissella cryptocerci]QBO35130.1 hypothetical protein EQG49_01005 [Periweissella cryptocerci]
MIKRRLRIEMMAVVATLTVGIFVNDGATIQASVTDYYLQTKPVDDDDAPARYGYGLAYLETDDFGEDGPANGYWKYLHPIKGYTRKEYIAKKHRNPKCMYNADKSGGVTKVFLKTKKRLWIGKTATGKKFWVKKGTVLNVGVPDQQTGVIYKKYTPYVVFRTDNLRDGYKIKTVNPIKLTKRSFTKVSVPSPLYHKPLGPRVSRPDTLITDSAVPTTSIHVTSDDYLEFNRSYKYADLTVKPAQSIKIQRTRVVGKTTYLYFNESISSWDNSLRDKKIGKYYRLTVTATKTKYFYNREKEYSEGYPVQWFNAYKVGGKAFVLQKS